MKETLSRPLAYILLFISVILTSIPIYSATIRRDFRQNGLEAMATFSYTEAGTPVFRYDSPHAGMIAEVPLSYGVAQSGLDSLEVGDQVLIVERDRGLITTAAALEHRNFNDILIWTFILFIGYCGSAYLLIWPIVGERRFQFRSDAERSQWIRITDQRVSGLALGLFFSICSIGTLLVPFFDPEFSENDPPLWGAIISWGIFGFLALAFAGLAFGAFRSIFTHQGNRPGSGDGQDSKSSEQ